MVIGSGLELFSFGYWGWGSSTPLLLEATAAVEEARGHAPPCFVNVRVARSVRAVGFRDRAFEELAGSDRYVWMPELGNKRVADRGDGEAEIVEPAAAGDLLDLAIERARRKQRIIFFCACDYPGTSRAPGCHRLLVTELLLEEARRRNLAMGIGEWPGGEPQDVTIKVTRSEFEKILSCWTPAQVVSRARRGGRPAMGLASHRGARRPPLPVHRRTRQTLARLAGHASASRRRRQSRKGVATNATEPRPRLETS